MRQREYIVFSHVFYSVCIFTIFIAFANIVDFKSILAQININMR